MLLCSCQIPLQLPCNYLKCPCDFFCADEDFLTAMFKDRVLGTQQVAEMINRSQKTVRSYIKEGSLRAARQGDHGQFGVLERVNPLIMDI